MKVITAESCNLSVRTCKTKKFTVVTRFEDEFEFEKKRKK